MASEKQGLRPRRKRQTLSSFESPIIPRDFHLNVITETHITKWHDSGFFNVFASPERAIHGAVEINNDSKFFAIADGRSVLLHDSWRSERQPYKLKLDKVGTRSLEV